MCICFFRNKLREKKQKCACEKDGGRIDIPRCGPRNHHATATTTATQGHHQTWVVQDRSEACALQATLRLARLLFLVWQSCPALLTNRACTAHHVLTMIARDCLRPSHRRATSQPPENKTFLACHEFRLYCRRLCLHTTVPAPPPPHRIFLPPAILLKSRSHCRKSPQGAGAESVQVDGKG